MTLSLADKDAIRDLIALYAHAIDRHSWGLMERIFHPDATFAFGPVQGGWRDFVGQATAIIESCIATHHQLGQMIIVPQGADAATAETYMTAMHIVPAGYPLTAVFPDRGEEYSAIIAGRYVDEFVRFGEEWRILKRTGVYDWREFREIGEATLTSVPAAARGAHDESDAASGIARYWLTS